MTANSLELEKSIIGSLLIAPEKACPIAFDRLKADDFENDYNRRVYTTLMETFQAGEVIDLYVIADKIQSPSIQIDYASYCVQCMESAPTFEGFPKRCEILHNDAEKRRLFELGDRVQALAIQPGTSADDIKAEFSKGMAALSEGYTRTNVLAGSEQFKVYETDLTAVYKDPTSRIVKTNYNSLDNALGGGLAKGCFYLIGARPGMGKTTLALNIAEAIAREKKVLFISLEMTPTQIINKRVSMESGILYSKLHSGELEEIEYQTAIKTAAKLSQRKFVLNRTYAVTVPDIGMMVRQDPTIEVVIVDYFGLITPNKRSVSKYEEATEISRQIKALALELNIPIICLAQLNRQMSQRQEKRPLLTDLRDSGSLEQDADSVILLHREAYYSEEPKEDDNKREVIELIVAKSRHGRPQTVNMWWQGKTGRIDDMDITKGVGDIPF